ncbi:MAG: 30S ribosomal protein S6 [Desulfobacteraceae bacterium]|nr:30S ribosomal protein S6 [Desulfobacteraceae bacterium]
MRMYETIFIADPDLQDEVRKTLFEKYKSILVQEGGILANFDDWGNKKLAYEIAKKPRGHYVCMTYGGTGELITELERNFRLDDKVLKYMTILLEKDVNPDALKQQIDDEAKAEAEAEAEAEAAKAEEAKAEEAEETSADETVEVEAETEEKEEEK